MSGCPELQVQEINVRFQLLHIGNCEEGHGLFLSKKDKSLPIVQDKEKEEKGVQGILSKPHMYTNMCASYASTPYHELLEKAEVQECGLVGHSNAESSQRHGAIKQMWLSEGGLAMIVLLKVLKKICPSPMTPDVTVESLSCTQTKEISLSRKTTRECRTCTSKSWRPKSRSHLFKQCRAAWKDTLGARLKRLALCKKPKPC